MFGPQIPRELVVSFLPTAESSKAIPSLKSTLEKHHTQSQGSSKKVYLLLSCPWGKIYLKNKNFRIVSDACERSRN